MPTCWNCMETIDEIGKDNAYCPHCGARHLQPCPYDECEGRVSIYEAACPECESPVTFCDKCHRIFIIGEGQCPVCEERVVLKERTDSFPTIWGTEDRPHVAVPMPEVTDESGGGAPGNVRMALKSAISRPIIRYGRLFVMRCVDRDKNQWQLCAFPEEGGSKPLWTSGTPIALTGDVAGTSDALELVAGAGRVGFVGYAQRGGTIHLHSAISGRGAMIDDYRWRRARLRFHGRHLGVLGVAADAQERFLVYELTNAGTAELVEVTELGIVQDRTRTGPLLLSTERGVVFADAQSNVWIWNPDSDTDGCEQVCGTLGGREETAVEISMAGSGELLLLTLTAEKDYTIHRLSLDNPQQQMRTVAAGLSLTLGAMSVGNRRVCVLEHVGGEEQPVFQVRELSGAREPSWQHRPQPVASGPRFLQVTGGDHSSQLIYVAAYRGARSVRHVGMQGAAASAEPVVECSAGSPVHLMYANDRAWACQLDEGNLYALGMEL